MATIWQIGAGDKEKNLMPIMLEKGIMIIGPGEIGDISLCNDKASVKAKAKLANIEIGKKDPDMLMYFRNSGEGEIVILRLGSVCFAVGAIAGRYEWRKEYEKIYSYWNKDQKYDSTEHYWDLQHTKKVDWFILKDEEAIYRFRRGIYPTARFSRVWDQKLQKYLESKGYTNKNGKELLNAIGDPCKVTKYGFPNGA